MTALPGPIIRSKSSARQAYNRMSRGYDLLTHWSEGPFRDQGLDLLNIQPGERVLEIGPGTGHALHALAQAVGPQGRVTGIDLSEGMLDVSEERLLAAGLNELVSLVQGDAAALPFENGGIDAIFMSFTLELFDPPEIPLVLRACRRVLRPDGRLAIVALSSSKPVGLPIQVYNWFQSNFPTYIDCRPIRLHSWVESSGMEIVEQVTANMWGLPLELIVCRR